MRFGVCLPNYGPRTSPRLIARAAGEAEKLGYDSLWATDHIVIPARMKLPYRNLYEALTVLSYAAAITEHIKLGTSVLVLPQRDPVLVAKQAATIDALSGGRLILGVGVGWIRGEFEALGYKFEDRGSRADEAILLMRALWRGERSFDGRYYRLENIVFSPRPARPGGPPIWIGGNSKAAIGRALRLGDAWHPVGLPPEELAGRAKLVKGKLPIALRLSIRVGGETRYYTSSTGERWLILGGSPGRIAETLEEYRKAGVEYVVASLGDERPIEEMRRLREEVLSRF